MKCIFVQILLLPLVTSYIPPVQITVYSSNGIKACIDDQMGMNKMEFHANVNKRISQEENGEISGYVTQSQAGIWCYVDRNVKIQIDDVLYYWVQLFTEDSNMSSSVKSKKIYKKDIYQDENIERVLEVFVKPITVTEKSLPSNPPVIEPDFIDSKNDYDVNENNFMKTTGKFYDFIDEHSAINNDSFVQITTIDTPVDDYDENSEHVTQYLIDEIDVRIEENGKNTSEYESPTKTIEDTIGFTVSKNEVIPNEKKCENISELAEKISEAHIRIKELESENEYSMNFLNWYKFMYEFLFDNFENIASTTNNLLIIKGYDFSKVNDDTLSRSIKNDLQLGTNDFRIINRNPKRNYETVIELATFQQKLMILMQSKIVDNKKYQIVGCKKYSRYNKYVYCNDY